MRTVIVMLCAAIAFMVFTQPEKQQATAQQELAKVEQTLNQIERDQSQVTIEVLDTMNKALERVTDMLEQHGKEIASIEKCQQGESTVILGRLTALEEKSSTTKFDGDSSIEYECDCAAKLADHEKRIAALEAKLATTTSTTSPQSNYMYPTVQPLGSNGGSTGGSTGTLAAGLGSSGTQARQAQTSYGSAGSAVVQTASAPVYQAPPASTVRTGPVRTLAAVATAPIARAGHWTYPGEIGNHLAKDHGVVPSGMTRQQMLDLHDSLHEGTQTNFQLSTPMVNVQAFSPARPPLIQRSQPAKAPMQVQFSQCPEGGCPPQTQVQRSQSGGWYLGKNLGRR
jgi:hypothetical protein